jgi:hypothetical protein
MYQGHFESTHSSRTVEDGYSTNSMFLDAASDVALYLILKSLIFHGIA